MRATFILIAICAVTFLIQQFIPGFTESLLLDSSKIGERPYTLLSSIFLHGDVLHLGYNMIALFFFGLILESIVGVPLFLAIFFIAGIDASFISLFFYERSLGASGAVMGLIGALAVMRPRTTAFALGVPMPMVAVAAFYIVLDVLGILQPTNIANAAHIAGLFIGIAAGLVLRRRFPEPRKRKSEKIVSEREMGEWENKWMGK